MQMQSMAFAIDKKLIKIHFQAMISNFQFFMRCKAFQSEFYRLRVLLTNNGSDRQFLLSIAAIQQKISSNFMLRRGDHQNARIIIIFIHNDHPCYGIWPSLFNNVSCRV